MRVRPSSSPSPIIWMLLAAGLASGPLRASAACPGDCSAPGAGPDATECLVEYDGVTLNYPPTSPKHVRCTDGDPACDLDGTANGTCEFMIFACLNNADPRFPTCTAEAIYRILFRANSPGIIGLDPQLVALAESVFAVLPTSTTVCSEPMPVSVPLKAGPRIGYKRIRSKAEANDGVIKDTDRFKLYCLPST